MVFREYRWIEPKDQRGLSANWSQNHDIPTSQFLSHSVKLSGASFCNFILMVPEFEFHKSQLPESGESAPQSVSFCFLTVMGEKLESVTWAYAKDLETKSK